MCSGDGLSHGTIPHSFSSSRFQGLEFEFRKGVKILYLSPYLSPYSLIHRIDYLIDILINNSYHLMINQSKSSLYLFTWST